MEVIRVNRTQPNTITPRGSPKSILQSLMGQMSRSGYISVNSSFRWITLSDITLRFGNAYEDPLSTSIQIKQTGKVQEYVDEFELALTQVTLPHEHSLSIFLARLEHNTQFG